MNRASAWPAWRQGVFWIGLFGGAAVGFQLSHRWRERERERLQQRVQQLEATLAELERRRDALRDALSSSPGNESEGR